LKGCRRVILDAVLQAQGKGCGPGVLGICLGGDRATGYEHSKRQFLRTLSDRNPEPALDQLEQDILQTANELGIGPMGFGGNTTLLGVKIGSSTACRPLILSVSVTCAGPFGGKVWSYQWREILKNGFTNLRLELGIF